MSTLIERAKAARYDHVHQQDAGSGYEGAAVIALSPADMDALLLAAERGEMLAGQLEAMRPELQKVFAPETLPLTPEEANAWLEAINHEPYVYGLGAPEGRDFARRAALTILALELDLKRATVARLTAENAHELALRQATERAEAAEKDRDGWRERCGHKGDVEFCHSCGFALGMRFDSPEFVNAERIAGVRAGIEAAAGWLAGSAKNPEHTMHAQTVLRVAAVFIRTLLDAERIAAGEK